MIWRYGSAILRDKASGDGGDGGGGDGGKGGDPFTPEQLTVLGSIVGQTVNSAVTNHMSRNLGKGIAEALKATNWGELLGPELAKLAPNGDDSGGKGGGGDDGKGKGGVSPELERQISKLADDLEKEKTARLAAVQEAENIRQSHQFGTARQRLYESLKPHASETLHDVWVDHLIHHKRLKVEDGKPLLEVEYSPVKGMPKQKEFLPLEEAIPHLVATEEAKRFQPVPESGDGKGSPGPRGSSRRNITLDPKDPADRVAARLEALGLDFNKEFSS